MSHVIIRARMLVLRQFRFGDTRHAELTLFEGQMTQFRSALGRKARTALEPSREIAVDVRQAIPALPKVKPTPEEQLEFATFVDGASSSSAQATA